MNSHRTRSLLKVSKETFSTSELAVAKAEMTIAHGPGTQHPIISGHTWLLKIFGVLYINVAIFEWSACILRLDRRIDS
jgi:hypothetical protein